MSTSRGRARFGVLVPFTNTNLEPDMVMMRPEGVSLHFARLGGYDQDEIPDSIRCTAWGPRIWVSLCGCCRACARM